MIDALPPPPILMRGLTLIWHRSHMLPRTTMGLQDINSYLDTKLGYTFKKNILLGSIMLIVLYAY